MILASEESQVSYSSVNLAWLSLVSGCIDVLSFVELRDLFASAMTGNTALLALAMSRGDWLAASRSLSALLAFGLGVALGTVMYTSHQSRRNGIRWLLVLELIFLIGCSILWSASSRPVEGSALYAVIVLLAISMGIQAVVARSINSLGVNTVVFTSALIRIAIATTGALGRRADLASLSNIKLDLETLAAYGCGAAVAGMLVAHHLGTLIWFPAAAVLVALASSELAGKPGGST